MQQWSGQAFHLYAKSRNGGRRSTLFALWRERLFNGIGRAGKEQLKRFEDDEWGLARGSTSLLW